MFSAIHIVLLHLLSQHNNLKPYIIYSKQAYLLFKIKPMRARAYKTADFITLSEYIAGSLNQGRQSINNKRWHQEMYFRNITDCWQLTADSCWLLTSFLTCIYSLNRPN